MPARSWSAKRLGACRETGLSFALNQSLAAGQVVGKAAVVGLVTSSAAADGSNTGNGVITLDATAPVAAGAKNGIYRVVNELVATNSGEFVVYDPDGIEIGRVAVAAIDGDDFDRFCALIRAMDAVYLAHLKDKQPGAQP